MKKLLIGIGIQLGSSALAILLAAILLPGFSVNVGGFITAVVVFTFAQLLLERLVAKLATQHAPALAGLASLVSTGLALLMATVPFGGIRISGLLTWVFAALTIWAATAVCGVAIPRYLHKRRTR